MTIRYEANPPKLVPGADMGESVSNFVGRVVAAADHCDAVHLTSDVLGFKRVSPIHAGRMIRKRAPDIPITVSLRIRDMGGMTDVEKFVQECVAEGFSGVLILRGDPPQGGGGGVDSGLVPSAAVKALRDRGYASKIDLYMSTPARPNIAKIQKKIDAKPAGFMTQVVRSPAHVRYLVQELKKQGRFSTIPIILYPSDKNAESAKFLNLDMDSYRHDFEGFVSEVYKTTGDVLVTSPRDFAGLLGFLREYKTPP